MDPLKLEVQVIVRCPLWVLRTKSKSPPRAAHAANGERLSISSNNYDCVFKSKAEGRGMEVSSRCDVFGCGAWLPERDVSAEKCAMHTGDFE